jgi:hypothetical protein
MGVWLSVMENIQRHPGYAGRSAIAACIAIQGLATVLFFMGDGRSNLSYMLVLAGAAGVMLLGASAIKRILDRAAF